MPGAGGPVWRGRAGPKGPLTAVGATRVLCGGPVGHTGHVPHFPNGGSRSEVGEGGVGGVLMAHDCGRWAKWIRGGTDRDDRSSSKVVPAGAEAAESVLVGDTGVGSAGTGTPPRCRRWRRGRVIVVIHVAAQAEGIFVVVVGLLVVISQRFVPEIVKVVREGRVLGWNETTTQDGVGVHFPKVCG